MNGIKLIELFKTVEHTLHAIKPLLITVGLTVLTCVELYRFVISTLVGAE